MVGKMVAGIFNFFISTIKNIVLGIINIPSVCINKVKEFRDYITNFKYKLSHFAESNFDLGIYHLHNLNLSDAIMRFKLVNRFSSTKNPLVDYWLGFAYYLKNNQVKALGYLEKTSAKESKELQNFLKNISICKEVPFAVWAQYRSLITRRMETASPIFSHENIELLVKTILKNIKMLPNDYKILEIGANLGLVGEEVKKRFPDSAFLVGVECGGRMYEELSQDHANYDKTILNTEYEFLNAKKDKFDIILSVCGISYTGDLTRTFVNISHSLNSQGYFAFCVRAAESTGFVLDKKEFCYKEADVLTFLKKSNLNILHKEKLSIEKNNNYLIFLCAQSQS
jgi:hypothetical protein